jgi:hypothetical protein
MLEFYTGTVVAKSAAKEQVRATVPTMKRVNLLEDLFLITSNCFGESI